MKNQEQVAKEKSILVEAYQKQMKEETKNLRTALAEIDTTYEIKQKFETERLQFQNASDQFKFEFEKLNFEMINLRKVQKEQTDQLKQEFETKKKVLSDEIKKLNLGATEYQTSIRTLEEKLSASKNENNCSNNRISELSDDLEAAKQQLEMVLTPEKMKMKISNDQNALALAVEEGNLEKVSSILKNKEVDINSEMKFETSKLEGPILTLAIKKGDIEMIKLLVQDFGADVNQKITWSQNQSNILTLAMAACFERYFLSFCELKHLKIAFFPEIQNLILSIKIKTKYD